MIGSVPGLVLNGLGGRFVAPRSYLTGFATNYPPGGVSTCVGGHWEINYPTGGFAGLRKTIEFEHRFWDWSSNSYTMDWILTRWDSSFLPTPPSTAEPINLHYRIRPTTRLFDIALDIGYYNDWYYIDLPPAPPDYWTPT